jgi:catecholate siderophore receptor
MRQGGINGIKKNTTEQPAGMQADASKPAFIQSAVRKPGTTALSLASVMLASSAAMAQDAGSSSALPTIDVQEAAGGGGSGYQTGQSQLSRMPVPLRDTPQTVNVVPQQVIQEQAATSVQDILRNVPGITFTAGEGGVQGENITIRGFTARNDIYRDGIRDPGWYTRDAFSIDRVEVFKGPSSFVFGRGSTGGVVNLVTKTPQQRDFLILEGTGSTAAGGRATIDFNKTFGDVAIRLGALGYDTDIAGRDYVHIQRYGFAPSISYKLNESTKNTFSYIYQKDDNVPDRGIPMMPGSLFGTKYQQPAPVPRNTWYGVKTPGQDDVEQTEAHILNNRFEHEFAPGLKFTNTTGFSYVDRFNRTRPVQPSLGGSNPDNLWNAPTGGTVYSLANPMPPGTSMSNVWIQNRNHFQNQTTNQLISNVSDLNAKFNTGTLEHNVLAGLEISREDRENYRTTFADSYRVNVANPNPWAVGILNTTTAATLSSSNTVGVYAQDQIKINKWLEVMGGVRFDNYQASAQTYSFNRLTGAVLATPAPTNLNANNDFVTYRAGVVVHPTENSSVYYMRGTSANPPAEFTTITNGQQGLDPVKSETDEVGVKVGLLNNRLDVNAALFRIKKKGDYEQLIAGDPTSYAPVGDSQVEGFEVGVAGKLTDQWSLFAGYTYLKSKLTASTINPGNIGHQLAMTPENSFSLWTTYDVTPELTVGGGAYYVDARWSSVANTARIPSYWRFDAMASYKVTRNFTLQLNVYNIADEYYYDTAAGAGFAVPGQERYASLTGRYQFEPTFAVDPAQRLVTK